MVFLDRTPRKDDSWLHFKVWSFTVGAGLALAGIYFNERWLIWAAIGVLALGFGARFLPASGSEEMPSEQEKVEPENPDAEAREDASRRRR